MTSQKLQLLQVPWQISQDGFIESDMHSDPMGTVSLTCEGHTFINPKELPTGRYRPYRVPIPLSCQSDTRAIATVFVTLMFPDAISIRKSLIPFVPYLYQFDSLHIPYKSQPYYLPHIEERGGNSDEEFCQWVSSGICPMPYAYEVEGSVWLSETVELMEHGDYWPASMKTSPSHHYIFCARNWLVEILSGQLTWTIDLMHKFK